MMPSAAAIAGRWVNDDGLVLALGDDSSFALAEATGRYEVQADTLTLIIPGQGRESFTFVHDPAAGTLILSSPNLGTPMTYRRTSGAGAKTPAPQRAKSASSDASDELIGRWTTSTPSGP